MSDNSTTTAKSGITIKNVVFSSGSIGGLCFAGAWKSLEDHDMVKNLIGFSGCSMGSIIALLTSVGYTGRELSQLAYALEYDDISDLKILNVFDNLGLDTGNTIQQLLHQLLLKKTGKTDLTFSQHHQITGRKLWINASSVDEDKCYYFSTETHPDMSIITAARMSISVPILIAAVKYDNKLFIDGGFHDPCPVHMFPAEDTLVFRIQNELSNSGSLELTDSSIQVSESNDFFRFAGLLMSSVVRRMYLKNDTQLKTYRVILLKTEIGGISLCASKKERKRLVKLGYDSTNKWLNGLKL
jgi:predicted acylesterase/phospholipase RssA